MSERIGEMIDSTTAMELNALGRHVERCKEYGVDPSAITVEQSRLLDEIKSTKPNKDANKKANSPRRAAIIMSKSRGY